MDFRTRQERGATVVEFVALAAAVAVLTVGVGVGFGGHGGQLGSDVAAHLRQIVANGPSVRGSVSVSGPEVFRRSSRSFGSGRTAHEQRWETSDDAPRVPRSDLQFTPVLPSSAVWDATAKRTAEGPAGITARGSGRVCAICIDAGWRDGFRTGVSTGRSAGGSTSELLNADAQFEGRAALLGIDLIGVVQQRAGWGGWAVHGRARATAGADTAAKITARFGSRDVELSASGGGMAGAAVRGEARAGVELLGIAASTRARVEGWAGAGIRGNASIARHGSTFSWDAGAGAALGLGGSFDWGGTVDVAKVPSRARTAALATISAAGGALLPGFGTLLQPAQPRSN